MTLITPEDDPGSFTFQILNEETDLVETLTINVIEVVTLLNMEGAVKQGDTELPTEPLVNAIRRCARPVKVVAKLEDHVLIAKFAAASLKLDQLGKELGLPPRLPPPTGFNTPPKGSQIVNTSPASL